MSRIVGLLICLGTIIAGAAFIAGIVLQYDKVVWALLVPVALVVLWCCCWASGSAGSWL